RVAHVGSSSVRYEVGIFGDDELCAAKGHFVHVYVDAASRRPTALPEKLKTVLETLR
ncbi:MAG TPA: acyl-CoA thioesterase, partial [Rhodoferax sp.]|nr:acyl-CoA thioesterase [Rhodoferax sp.]